MYNYLISNPIFAIIFLLLVLAFVLFLVIKFVQRVGLEKVRAIVYEGFVQAEHAFYHGENVQKFEYVVQLARSALPRPFNLFITESLLRKTIQLWFDLCKDLLDDGKLNNTTKDEE